MDGLGSRMISWLQRSSTSEDSVICLTVCVNRATTTRSVNLPNTPPKERPAPFHLLEVLPAPHSGVHPCVPRPALFATCVSVMRSLSRSESTLPGLAPLPAASSSSRSSWWLVPDSAGFLAPAHRASASPWIPHCDMSPSGSERCATSASFQCSAKVERRLTPSGTMSSTSTPTPR
jgi:hypothetical protein